MKNKKFIIFIGLILLVLILNHTFGWSDYIGNTRNLKFMEQMVLENIWLAIIIYIIVTVVGCVVLALPGIAFAILAGALFGPIIGTICCSLATTIGAILAFGIGRFFLKESVKTMAMKNRYLKRVLFHESMKNEVFILMITRLVPIFPYNLQNFAYGVTDIKFRTYALGSFLFMLPGTAMYTIGTAGLTDQENRWLYIAIAVVLALVVVGLGTFFKKKYIGCEEAGSQNGSEKRS